MITFPAVARRHFHSIILLVLLLSYLTVSLRNLTVVPRVYEDEPWQASSGWKLATENVFGTDLFAGFYHMERRYYGYMPLHPLLLSVVFRIAGVGLFQSRFEPVLMGLFILVLAYTLALRLFHDWRIGLLTILLLLTLRLTGLTYIQHTGILLFDMARIARYDMVVPVFGLASLHAYVSGRESGNKIAFFLAGLLSSLSGLAHLYGFFWVPTLILLALWDRRPFANVVAIVVGFVVPLVPYLAYLVGDLPDWRGQTRQYGNRFELLSPAWYLRNLLQERHRYGPGLGPARSAVLRIGFWSSLATLPCSLLALTRRAFGRGDEAARVVTAPLIIFPCLFALLIHLKLVNYTVSFMPLVAMALAWGGIKLWSKLARNGNARWARLALALILSGILVEGATRIAALERAASVTTPYYNYISRVREHLPAGARVLGLHNYWFGLEEFDYRSFVVPIWWTDPHNAPRPLSLDEGLDRVAPDIVLLDQRMRDYFGGVGADDSERFSSWLRRHDASLIGSVDDSTYGLMEIYRIPFGPIGGGALGERR